MVRVDLNINSYGSAFAVRGEAEVGRILRDLATRIERDTQTATPQMQYRLTDINGNNVGNAYVLIEDEEGEV